MVTTRFTMQHSLVGCVSWVRFCECGPPGKCVIYAEARSPGVSKRLKAVSTLQSSVSQYYDGGSRFSESGSLAVS